MTLHKDYKKLILVLLVLFSLLAPEHAMGYTTGKVIDFVTGKPVSNAFVTLDNNIVLTDENGRFVLKNMGNKIAVRAYGYLRNEQIIIAPLITLPLEIKLMPFTPKALYLSPYGIGSRILRGSALRLIEETELNALVIDIKGDRGFIPYKSSIPLAGKLAAKNNNRERYE